MRAAISASDRLLIAGNAGGGADALFAKLGVRPMMGAEPMGVTTE